MIIIVGYVMLFLIGLGILYLIIRFYKEILISIPVSLVCLTGFLLFLVSIFTPLIPAIWIMYEYRALSEEFGDLLSGLIITESIIIAVISWVFLDSESKWMKFIGKLFTEPTSVVESIFLQKRERKERRK